MSEVIDYYALLCVTVIVKATLTYSLVLSFIALYIKYSFNKHLLTNKLLVYPARLILFTVSVMLPLDIKKTNPIRPKTMGVQRCSLLIQDVYAYTFIWHPL